GKGKTEPSRPFGGRNFGGHVVVGKVYAVVMRFRHLGLVGKPARTLVLIERWRAGYGHDGKLSVIIHPGRWLMGLFKPADLIGCIRIHPPVAHLAGLG